MKQTNKLPRRVGFSLLKSLYRISETLLRTIEQRSSDYHDALRIKMIEKNKTLVTQKDIDALKSIQTFYGDTIAQLERKNSTPSGAFISVAKHSKPELKYVSTPTAVGIVLTTSMLKRMLELSTTVGYEVRGDKKADRYISYVCESFCGYTSNDSESSVSFLRILDVLRYFEEVGSILIEISLAGVHNDVAIENKGHRNYYSRYNNSSSEWLGTFNPMLSDRYQQESWKHYLSTLYTGLCTPDNLCAIATPLPMSIMMAELKGVTV